jgi:hypothetical protein
MLPKKGKSRGKSLKNKPEQGTPDVRETQDDPGDTAIDASGDTCTQIAQDACDTGDDEDTCTYKRNKMPEC